MSGAGVTCNLILTFRIEYTMPVTFPDHRIFVPAHFVDFRPGLDHNLPAAEAVVFHRLLHELFCTEIHGQIVRQYIRKLDMIVFCNFGDSVLPIGVK